MCIDDDVHTGPDSDVELKFEDGAHVTIKEMTEIRIRGLVKKEDRIQTQLLLKMGELKAQVKPQTVIRSDFSVQSITAAASVRGTVFSVKYDEVSVGCARKGSPSRAEENCKRRDRVQADPAADAQRG